MRQSENGTQFTERNQYIRMCIAKALIQLLDKNKLEEITITALVKVANVSRMTFYKYYVNKQEVLVDYMYEMMHEYMKETKQRTDIGAFREYKHICHSLKFFRQYADEISILVHAGMYGIIINAVNDYMDSYVLPVSKYTKYELYYYAGALCNVFIKWIEMGMIEKPEEIARIVYKYTEV